MISHSTATCQTKISNFPHVMSFLPTDGEGQSRKIHELLLHKMPFPDHVNASREEKDFAIARFIKFLRKIKLKKLI